MDYYVMQNLIPPLADGIMKNTLNFSHECENKNHYLLCTVRMAIDMD